MRFHTIIICLIFAVLFAACNKTAYKTETFSKDIPERDTPSSVVKLFWEKSLSNQFNDSAKYIAAAPVSYLYWKPSQSANKNRVEISGNQTTIKIIKSDGIGSSNPNLEFNEFAEKLNNDWTKIIFEQQIVIDSIKSEVIEKDKAEVVVNLKKSNWVSFYELRVLLRDVNGEWKIIALWDRING